MAYLDNRTRTDGRIFLLAFPAVMYFALAAAQAADTTGVYGPTLTELVPVVRAGVFVSPLLVAIQVFRIWDGVAANSWQNWLFTLVTAAASAKIWTE